MAKLKMNMLYKSAVPDRSEFFDKKNLQFKNVQGRIFLNDAVRGGSDTR